MLNQTKIQSISNIFDISVSDISLKQQLEEMEKQILMSKLKLDTSIRKNAKKSGLSHTALLNKIKKYNIEIGNK